MQKSEKYLSFLSENFQFLEIKFSIYLNRRVFIMLRSHYKRAVGVRVIKVLLYLAVNELALSGYPDMLI